MTLIICVIKRKFVCPTNTEAKPYWNVCHRERFTAGLCKETDSSCPQIPNFDLCWYLPPSSPPFLTLKNVFCHLRTKDRIICCLYFWFPPISCIPVPMNTTFNVCWTKEREEGRSRDTGKFKVIIILPHFSPSYSVLPGRFIFFMWLFPSGAQNHFDHTSQVRANFYQHNIFYSKFSFNTHTWTCYKYMYIRKKYMILKWPLK